MHSIDSTPCIIQEGVFGATFNKNGEELYLRMERLTEENAKCWSWFKERTYRVANASGRGILGYLLVKAGEPGFGYDEELKDATGFTKEEFNRFIEKATHLKKTNNKIKDVICNNSVGSNHMCTFFDPARFHYIAYITKNRNFSIQNVDMTGKNLKNFIESYNDLLITVGSDFSEKNYFSNRGISRNPYWVFEEKYSGLSMILLGFTGAVAAKYFPEKKEMRVQPVGSMQSIIIKNLLRGEGYTVDRDGIKKADIVDLKSDVDDPEGDFNHIQIPALNRIYNKASEL